MCGLIVQVRVVPRRTVVGDIDRRFDNLSGSHHQSHGQFTVFMSLVSRAVMLLAVETDWSSLVWFACFSGLFCLSLISRLYGAGNCWHRLSGVRSKLVNQLSKVSRW